MINANELRINNLLRYGNIICKVTEIEQFSYRVIDDEGISYKNTWADITPIPLTEDWLIRFGFTIVKEVVSSLTEFLLKDIYKGLKTAHIGENPVTDDYLFALKSNGDNWYFQNKFHTIKYVHQLQNLYFCLTGEELTLKEE